MLKFREADRNKVRSSLQSQMHKGVSTYVLIYNVFMLEKVWEHAGNI